MKKRAYVQLLLILFIIILSLTACEVTIAPDSPIGNIMGVTGESNSTEPEGTPPTEESESPEEPAGDYNNDEITFDKGERVKIVFSEDAASFYNDLMSPIFRSTGVVPRPRPDTTEQEKNEITIGKCNRSVSQKAYAKLETVDRTGKYVARFAIYAYDNSVGIAFDTLDGYTDVIGKYAINYFIENHVNDDEAIDISNGYYYVGTFDIAKYQEEKDREYEALMWANFENVAGAEAAAALREMYETMYLGDHRGDVADWLAGLFDAEYGGFYYSESARDNEQVEYDNNFYDLLPDIESTAQALGIIGSSGMISEFENVNAALPEWMRNAIVKFIKERQDPNGYFYHPQWTKAMVDDQYSRRGRDLGSAIGILDMFGARPTYDTSLGDKGDGKRWDGTPVSVTKLTMPLGTSQVAAVSCVVAVASDTLVPSNLVDDVAFRDYLAGFEDPKGEHYIYKDSYWIGNQLSSQAAQIKQRDNDLQAMGVDYSLVDILGDWLDDKCLEKTGAWHLAACEEDATTTAKFTSLNGFMKISSAYNSIGRALPYPVAASLAAAETIDLQYEGEKPTVCWVYNSWFSICNIIGNVREYMEDKDAAAAIIKDIREQLHEKAPTLIRATMNKQNAFICEDGSFSYTVASSSATSQSMPVAIPKTKEGDVNATVICTTGTLGNMLNALGYPKVPFLFRTDFNRFIDTIEENKTSTDSLDN